MSELIVEVAGTAFDAPTACYRTSEPESLVGVEITDMAGQLEGAHVGVFITCGNEGRKVLLKADAARGLADVLMAMAVRIDAGATTAETN